MPLLQNTDDYWSRFDTNHCLAVNAASTPPYPFMTQFTTNPAGRDRLEITMRQNCAVVIKFIEQRHAGRNVQFQDLFL